MVFFYHKLEILIQYTIHSFISQWNSIQKNQEYSIQKIIQCLVFKFNSKIWIWLYSIQQNSHSIRKPRYRPPLLSKDSIGAPQVQIDHPWRVLGQFESRINVKRPLLRHYCDTSATLVLLNYDADHFDNDHYDADHYDDDHYDVERECFPHSIKRLLTTHRAHHVCINTIPQRIQWKALLSFSPFTLLHYDIMVMMMRMMIYILWSMWVCV